MSARAAYVYHVRKATGLSPDAIRYRLPLAQGLQLLTLQLRSLGHKFLGAEIPDNQRFEHVVKCID